MRKKSPLVKRIQLAAEQIVASPPKSAQLVFTPRELVQTTLPHSDPGNVPIWKRRNGNLSLIIQPGYSTAKEKLLGYPYGSIPRLLVIWMTAEVLRTNTRRIELCDSLAEFMRSIGLNSRNGTTARSDRFRLSEQAERLFSARISFQKWGEIDGKRYESRVDMLVAPKAHLWWSDRHPSLAFEEGSWVELGEEFFNAIIENPIPLDHRSIQAIKNSPLAIDTYCWATLRAYAAQQKDKPQFVSWEALHNQMGGDYKNIWNFQQNLKKALEKVKSVYPWFQFEYTTGGITVIPCVPSISRKSRKQNLKSVASVPSVNHQIQVSAEAFGEACIIIANAGTGWCKYALESQFYEYASKRGTPRNIDKAFLGFVSKKVKKRP
ncbi:plasmid encoded RepA protein [Brasilonema sp. CT11]|nr:plasmid encoded RepA protein [Brasilonema sp. CT11]